MKIYIANSTVSVYLLDIKEADILAHTKTIQAVKEEVMHLRNKELPVDEIKIEKSKIEDTPELPYLSFVDRSLLETAKARNAVLITDDRKLANAAKKNNVMVLNTPRFISELAFDNFLSYEKAEQVLMDLKPLYIRVAIIEKVIKNLKNWR